MPRNIYKFVIEFNYSFAQPKPEQADTKAPTAPGSPAAAATSG
jgi:hypothetical protein